jgi:hypothetical protein
VKLPAMERESTIKSNQRKEKNKARKFGPGGRIVGGGGSASRAVPGRRCENTAGRGLRWAQVPRSCPCLDPHAAASGKSPSRTRWTCRWDSWGSKSLFQDRHYGWPFEVLILWTYRSLHFSALSEFLCGISHPARVVNRRPSDNL